MMVYRFFLLLGVIVANVACSSTSAPTSAPICDSVPAKEISIANHDAYGAAPYYLGYPPYAVDGCSLVYVAPSANLNTPGELRLRNLAFDEETTLAEAALLPRRPVLTGHWVAWEADVESRSLIHVMDTRSKETIIIDGDFDHATEPRISSSAVVFTAWLGPENTADTDIAMYELKTKSWQWVGRGPGQQRFADISETHIAYSDFNEDPDGRFDENDLDVADIVVFDRSTQTAEARPRIGKQAFPMLGATGKLAFLDWNLVHPEPKLVAYDLRLVDLASPLSDSVLVESIRTAAPYIRPIAHGTLLEWVAMTDMINATLWRLPTDSGAPQMVFPPDSTQRFAPTATDTMTFLGIQSSDGAVTLQAFAR